MDAFKIAVVDVRLIFVIADCDGIGSCLGVRVDGEMQGHDYAAVGVVRRCGVVAPGERIGCSKGRAVIGRSQLSGVGASSQCQYAVIIFHAQQHGDQAGVVFQGNGDIYVFTGHGLSAAHANAGFAGRLQQHGVRHGRLCRAVSSCGMIGKLTVTVPLGNVPRQDGAVHAVDFSVGVDICGCIHNVRLTVAVPLCHMPRQERAVHAVDFLVAVDVSNADGADLYTARNGRKGNWLKAAVVNVHVVQAVTDRDGIVSVCRTLFDLEVEHDDFSIVSVIRRRRVISPGEDVGHHAKVLIVVCSPQVSGVRAANQRQRAAVILDLQHHGDNARIVFQRNGDVDRCARLTRGRAYGNGGSVCRRCGLPDRVQGGIGILRKAPAGLILRRRCRAALRPAQESIARAGGDDAADGQGYILGLGLRSGRARAAVGVIGDGVGFWLHRHRAGGGFTAVVCFDRNGGRTRADGGDFPVAVHCRHACVAAAPGHGLVCGVGGGDGCGQGLTRALVQREAGLVQRHAGHADDIGLPHRVKGGIGVLCKAPTGLVLSCCRALTLRPAQEGVTGAGGNGAAQGQRNALGLGLRCGRAGAAVGVVGNGIGLCFCKFQNHSDIVYAKGTSHRTV